ncbi:toxin glutamine deamidase domain-containing protein [Planotetraspora silvatica]
MARRHARWRLPTGVYNPIVSADGRRWRDYERAAETPASGENRHLDDRHVDDLCTEGRVQENRHAEVRAVVLADGPANSVAGGMVNASAKSMANGLANGMSNGTSNGTSTGLLSGLLNGLAKGARNGLVKGTSNPLLGGTPNGLSEAPGDSLADGPNAGLNGGLNDGLNDGVVEDAAEGAVAPVADATGDTATHALEGAAFAADPASEAIADAAVQPGTQPGAQVEAQHGTQAGAQLEVPAETSVPAPVEASVEAVAGVRVEAPAPAPVSTPAPVSALPPAPASGGEGLADLSPVASAEGVVAETAAPDAGIPVWGERPEWGQSPARSEVPPHPDVPPRSEVPTVSDVPPQSAVPGWEQGPMRGPAGSRVRDDAGTDLEPDWFDSARRPPRLETTRPYGKPGGLAESRPGTEEILAQASLVQAVSGRFPDPRGTWIRLINAEGPTEDPFRSTNAVDCALAVMSTWHGEPVVAARRQPEFDAGGKPLLTGETGGVARAEQWLGHRFEYVGHGRRAYVAIAQRLVFGGHGASAMLITRWPGGGSHAWNAVNCRDEVLWIDAQRGHMAVEPPYEVVTGVFCVVIDREGQRL